MIKLIKNAEYHTCDELGNIYGLHGNKLIPKIDKYGYLTVQIRYVNVDKLKTRTVHRLIAETFLENIENKSQVNHINGDKKDNRLCNLEWCTAKENIVHAHKTGLHKGIRTKVNATHIITKQIFEFSTMTSFAKYIHRDKSYVYRRLKGKNHCVIDNYEIFVKRAKRI